MHRTNNFDILRLFFAVIVLLAHSVELSQNPSLFWILHLCNARIAVEAFFAMSGFLIVGSYERSSSSRQYLVKRARRILPAYWTALLFCLVLGAMLTTLTLSRFLASSQTWIFAICNLTFVSYLHPSLPGVFAQNPSQTAVNGALWTIKLEVLFYLLVPGIVWACRRLGRWQTPLVIFVCSIAYQMECLYLRRETLAKQLPGQMCFFAVGILIYYFLDEFTSRKAATWVVVVCVGAAYALFGGLILEALAVPIATMAAAFLLPRIEGPTKYGDFSYGIYVFHFPILQAFVAVGAFATHPYLALAETLIAVATISIVSWRLVESPSLKQKKSRRTEWPQAVNPARSEDTREEKKTTVVF